MANPAGHLVGKADVPKIGWVFWHPFPLSEPWVLPLLGWLLFQEAEGEQPGLAVTTCMGKITKEGPFILLVTVNLENPSIFPSKEDSIVHFCHNNLLLCFFVFFFQWYKVPMLYILQSQSSSWSLKKLMEKWACVLVIKMPASLIGMPDCHTQLDLPAPKSAQSSVPEPLSTFGEWTRDGSTFVCECVCVCFCLCFSNKLLKWLKLWNY